MQSKMVMTKNVDDLAEELLRKKLVNSKLDATRMAKSMVGEVAKVAPTSGQAVQNSQRIVGYSGPHRPHMRHTIGTDEQHEPMSHHVGDLKEQIEVLQQQIAQMQQMHAALEEKMGEHTQVVANLEQRHEALHSKVQEHEQIVARHDEIVQRHEQLHQIQSSTQSQPQNVPSHIEVQLQEAIEADVASQHTSNSQDEQMLTKLVEEPINLESAFANEQSEEPVQQDIKSEFHQTQVRSALDIAEQKDAEHELDFIQSMDREVASEKASEAPKKFRFIN